MPFPPLPSTSTHTASRIFSELKCEIEKHFSLCSVDYPIADLELFTISIIIINYYNINAYFT